MIRLFKYLKPYLLSVALIVALLFLQANADLALPDYMSKIVNIGIQQSGISDSIPQAIGKDRLDKALLFMDAGGREKVKSVYDLVEADTPAYAALAKKYPKSQGVALYSLKKIGQSERGDLSERLAKALSAVEFLGQAQADPAKASQMAAGMGMDLSKLPAGMDLFTVLAKMPEAQSAAILTAINARFEGIDPMLVEQMGIKAVRDEYNLLGADIGRLQASYTLSMGGLMLLLTLLSVVSTIIVGYLGSRTAAGVARDLRKDLFSRVESFSFVELDKFSTASLITRSTNDITQVQMVTLMGLRMFFYAPIMGIGGVIRAMGKASAMWWIIALAVGILLALIVTVFSISVPRFKIIQKLIDKLNLVVRENLSGMMVIRAFTMQDHEAKRFDKANRDLTGTMLFVTRVMVVMMPLMMLIMNLVSILILWTGAHEVAQSQIRIGDMMAFMQYSMQIFFSFLMLSMMFIILPRAAVSGDRIAEVLGTEPSIKDSAEEGASGVQGCGLQVSRGQRGSAAGRKFRRETWRDDGYNRHYGLGQIDSRQSYSAFLRLHPRNGIGGWHERQRPSAERIARRGRLCAPESLAFFRDYRVQPSLRQGVSLRRRHEEGPGNSPGHGIRRVFARRDGGRNRPGRRQRIGWTKATPHYRQGPRQGSPDLHFRRQFFRLGLQDGHQT